MSTKDLEQKFEHHLSSQKADGKPVPDLPDDRRAMRRQIEAIRERLLQEPDPKNQERLSPRKPI
jgi:hypothetical protein